MHVTALDTSLGKHVFPAYYIIATAAKYVTGSAHSKS